MFIIITTRTIHHEGDERSRTNPGHGYPAYSEDVSNVEYIDDFDKFKEKIERYEGNVGYGKQAYKAFEATPVKVTKSISLNITK